MDGRFGEARRVLVVDDEQVILVMLRAVLEDLGFSVETAPTLAAGRAATRAGAFDLVLLDKNLPDGTGLELARELSARRADCEVLLMSGYANLSSAVEAMQYQVADYLVKPFELDDLEARLRRALESLELKRTNRRLLAELVERNATLERLATRDPLTGLENHGAFQEALKRELARSRRHGLPLSVVVVDVDGFKRLNDALGHAAGDTLLRACGEVLVAGAGDPQAAEGERAARYEADEFAVLLPETGKAAAAGRAAAIRDALASRLAADGRAVTLSCGVASIPEDAVDRDGLLSAARIALAAAKSAGGNRLLSYTRELARDGVCEPSNARAEAARLSAAGEAIARHAFHCAFQRVVDRRTGKPFAFEALLRPDDRAFESPLELVHAAARAGRIVELGLAFREAAVERFAEAPPDALLFLNLHPCEFVAPGRLEREPALAPFARRIVFELTEATGLDDYVAAGERIAALREAGFRVALDDLGAGYSGLNRLALLQPDFVKLDIALVRGARSDRRCARLLKRVLEFCRDESLPVIAEGVENEAELEVVAELGVDLVQGFHFGMPARGFDTVLRPTAPLVAAG